MLIPDEEIVLLILEFSINSKHVIAISSGMLTICDEVYLKLLFILSKYGMLWGSPVLLLPLFKLLNFTNENSVQFN